MLQLVRAAALVLALLPSAVLAQAGGQTTSSAPGAKAAGFISTMSVRHLFAIECAGLVATRQPGPKVRDLAHLLKRDHGRALATLRQVTEKAGLPAPEDELGSRHQAELDALREHDTTTFDRAFVVLQSEVNAETLAIVEHYAARGKNRPLRLYAHDLLPTLQRHGDALRQLR
jgi:predicted outer membrane protein